MNKENKSNRLHWSLPVFLLLLAGCQTTLHISMNSSKDMLSFKSFEKAATVISILEESGLSAKDAIKGIRGFHSMLDLFLEINSMKDQADIDAFLEKRSSILSRYERVDSEGNTNAYCCLKIAPEYAAIVNPSGDVRINGRIYSLLNDGDAAVFGSNMRKALENQVKSASEGPVRMIPMWAGLTVGDKYPTTDFRLMIDGRATVVQLWKGYYPAAMGVGGVGAEVGLYHASSPAAAIWFPDYMHPRKISYSLVYTKTGKALIHASGMTWWLNAWKLGTFSPSLNGRDYTLYYSIEGIEGAW
jgi:hypothetical protein